MGIGEDTYNGRVIEGAMIMTQPSSPINKSSMTKASVIGSVMAVGGIILFVILYTALRNSGADPVQRVVVALCIPPILMGVLVGGYFWFMQRGKTQDS